MRVECAEDERLSNGVRGACVSARAVTTRHSATRWAQNHVPLSKYSRISPCALLFLQVPTTVKTSKMLGSVSEGAVDEECMAEAK